MIKTPNRLTIAQYKKRRLLFWAMVCGTGLLIIFYIDGYVHTIELGVEIDKVKYTLNNEKNMLIFSILDPTISDQWESDFPIYLSLRSRSQFKGWDFQFDPGWDTYGFDYIDFWDSPTVFNNAVYVAWHISLILIFGLLTFIYGLWLNHCISNRDKKRCLNCGYNQQGLSVSSSCPECGYINTTHDSTQMTDTQEQSTCDWH